MATFTVAAIQVAYDDVESIADRITRVSDLVRATAAEHAGLDLIVLPELWAPTGFDYERWESDAEPLGGPFTQTMSALATEIGVTLHAGSFVERLPEPGAGRQPASGAWAPLRPRRSPGLEPGPGCGRAAGSPHHQPARRGSRHRRWQPDWKAPRHPARAHPSACEGPRGRFWQSSA